MTMYLVLSAFTSSSIPLQATIKASASTLVLYNVLGFHSIVDVFLDIIVLIGNFTDVSEEPAASIFRIVQEI